MSLPATRTLRARRPRARWWAWTLAGVALLGWGPSRAAEPSTQPWLDMDYGPFLTASIEVPEPRTNIAYKGIAIRLADAFGGSANEAVLFDTDLLRYAAGWTGDFVELKGVVFDGEHWAYPRIQGHQVFGNPAVPGWGKSGSFDDPRPLPYGPLPKDWAHWTGLHLSSNRVILSYRVGTTPVLEMPGLERQGTVTAFTRLLNVGPGSAALDLQVAGAPGTRATFLSRVGLQPVAGIAAADATLAVHGRAGGDVLAGAVVDAPTGSEWRVTRDGSLRLHLAAPSKPWAAKLLLWQGHRNDLPRFAELVAGSGPAPDLSPWTRGGPARWPQTLVTQGVRGADDGPFAVDTLTAPDDNPWRSWLRFGGLDLFADGRRAALGTWNGDVWVVDGVDGDLAQLSWRRVATGLFQPLGLKIVNDQIHVLGRDQITRLHDLNGDGEADYYENFNNDCCVSEHFHEFATDLKTDADGNFYYIKCARHALPAVHPHHGTLLRLPPDGSRLEVVARGFRAVNGLGVGPDGELTCVDNQGHWMPGNRINWVQPGGWYGNQWAWNPDQRTRYDEPLCWMHNEVDRSGGTHLWVPSGQWGPLERQLLTLSYGMGQMFLVLTEAVEGVRQGGVTRFPLEFETGVMRGVFHPVNHQLYACGLYGWAGNKTRPGAFHRIRRTRLPLRMPVALRVAADGLVIDFAEPLDPQAAADPGNYSVQAWNYRWTAEYGSPDFKPDGTPGRQTLEVPSASVSADGRRVFLRLPDLQPVMQMHVAFSLQGADGQPVRNFIHHTIHRLGARPGLEQLGAGSQTAEPVVAAPTAPLRDAPGLVQRIHRLSEPERPDLRVARVPALALPEGDAASAFVPAGPFACRWDGFVRLDLNQDVRFHLEGRGTATLELNDRPALHAVALTPEAVASDPIRLHRGLNAFRLHYTPPPTGDPELRVLWSTPGRLREPVPAAAFAHDADTPDLAAATARRDGRRLFLDHRCFRCHAVSRPWSDTSAPELNATGPALEGVTDRLQSSWLPAWLANPRSMRPEIRMPRLLHGDRAEVAQDAADLAAFLSSVRSPPHLQPAPPATPPTDGRGLYDRLGCVACHRLARESELPADPRLPLHHVPRKWRSDKLAAFLQQPQQHDPWIRMPDFRLSSDEAGALAALVLDPENHGAAIEPGDDAMSTGDPLRGRERFETLGCAACHTLPGVTNRLLAPALLEIAQASAQRGCLASDPGARGQAPDFAFAAAEVSALQAFLRADPATALDTDTAVEFLDRHYHALRCNACHARDLEPDVWSSLPTPAPPPKSGPDYGEEPDATTGAGSVHLGRPALTVAGEKLHADWMQRFLTGQLPYKPRPESQGRMPGFPTHGARLAEGIAREHGIPPAPQPRPLPDPALVRIGQRLTQVGEGLGCVTCHDVGRQRALAGADTATINFAFVADRLRPDYFWRYLRDPQQFRPGTMMPSFIAEDGTTPIKGVLDGDAARQFDAIWQYLLSLDPAAAR